MSIVRLPTGDVYYEVHGEGVPLICVAGFAADHRSWEILIPTLSKHFQIVIFDNHGCGQSSTPDIKFSIGDFANTVIQLCDFLQIDKAYFLGNSMGGAIVQQLAYTYPKRVLKAVISNSFIRANGMSFALFAQAREKWFDSTTPRESIIHAVLSWCFSGNFLTKENINLLTELNLNYPYPQTSSGYKFQLQALLPFDSSSWIQDITVPCLFIASDEDAICFPSQIQAMANKVRGSEYLLIRSAGHLPHIEYPQLFSDKIIDFCP